MPEGDILHDTAGDCSDKELLTARLPALDCMRALCMVYPSSPVDWNRQECNRQSMQWVQTTWSNWDWIVSKCSDTNVIFQAAVFLIRVITN